MNIRQFLPFNTLRLSVYLIVITSVDILPGSKKMSVEKVQVLTKTLFNIRSCTLKQGLINIQNEKSLTKMWKEIMLSTQKLLIAA